MGRHTAGLGFWRSRGVRAQIAVALGLVFPLLVSGPLPARSQQAAPCRIVLGFATLRDGIAALEGRDPVGACLGDEQALGDGAVQRTERGVFVWRGPGTPAVFTGAEATWTWGPGGLQKVETTARVPSGVPGTLGFAPGIDYLFLVQAPSGTLVPLPGGEPDRYLVTLERPAPTMQWFSNRPQRLAGHNTLENFVQAWEVFGFGDDPPNTAIALTAGAEEHEDTLIVEMFTPVLDSQRGTLTFEARVLRDDEAHGLAYYADRADRTLPARFGPVSLFIDSAPVTVLPDCFEMNNPDCLRSAYLPNSNLSGASLIGLNFSGAMLGGSDLSRADLSGANLSGAYLVGVNFSGANMHGTNLSNANLTGANLTGAYLQFANLTFALHGGANFTGADCTHAAWVNGWVQGSPTCGVR